MTMSSLLLLTATIYWRYPHGCNHPHWSCIMLDDRLHINFGWPNCYCRGLKSDFFIKIWWVMVACSSLGEDTILAGQRYEKVKCINNILGLYLENIFNIGSGLLFLSFAAVKFCLVSFLKPWIPKQNRYDMPIKRNYVPNLVFLGCSVQPVSNLFRFLDMQKIEQSLAGKR